MELAFCLSPQLHYSPFKCAKYENSKKENEIKYGRLWRCLGSQRMHISVPYLKFFIFRIFVVEFLVKTVTFQCVFQGDAHKCLHIHIYSSQLIQNGYLLTNRTIEKSTYILLLIGMPSFLQWSPLTSSCCYSISVVCKINAIIFQKYILLNKNFSQQYSKYN